MRSPEAFNLAAAAAARLLLLLLEVLADAPSVCCVAAAAAESTAASAGSNQSSGSRSCSRCTSSTLLLLLLLLLCSYVATITQAANSFCRIVQLGRYPSLSASAAAAAGVPSRVLAGRTGSSSVKNPDSSQMTRSSLPNGPWMIPSGSLYIQASHDSRNNTVTD
jgi:hypothetical protein